MKVGDLVKFKDPMTDDEKTALMRIVEDRGERMLVSDLRHADWRIVPTAAYFTKELVLA